MKFKLLYLFKFLISIVVVCSMFMVSMSNVGALSKKDVLSSNCQVITINGKRYSVSVNENADKTVTIVKDENGHSDIAVFNKKTDKIIVNGNVLEADNTVGTLINSEHSSAEMLSSSLAKSKNKVLKRKVYKIPSYLTISVSLFLAALTVISPYRIATSIASELFSLSLAGKPVKVTITEYRSANRYKSGHHKGRYKYWTNYLVKCGNITLLNINDSVMYK